MLAQTFFRELATIFTRYVFHDLASRHENLPQPATPNILPETSRKAPMAPLVQTFDSSVGLSPNSYIYKILSTSPRQDPLTYKTTDQLAVISSDDSLRFVDPTTLQVLPDGIIKHANQGITCLERAEDLESNLVATAGRDGFVHFWDKRSRQKAMAIQSREYISGHPRLPNC